MWQDIINGLTKDAEYHPPALLSRIEEVESALRIELPETLRSLLRETNGVNGEYGLGLVWDIDRIELDNLQFRQNDDFKRLYMPFDHLLFFADAGNGDQFAYPIQDGCIRRDDIFVWAHESDDRRWVAGSLKQYLQWWLDGTLSL